MSNVKPIDVRVSGLKPYEQYSFSFANKGGNWPIRVSPLSGEFFVTNKDTIYDIKTFAYFCPATGYCPPTDPTVFFNTPNTDISVPGLDVGPESLYSVMGLSVTEKSTGKVVFTYPCSVECDDCLPKLGASSDNVILDDVSGNSTTLSTTVSGLIPNQLYRYTFTGLDANWPVKILPMSGYIQTPNSDYTINAIVSFCPSIDGCSDSVTLPYRTLENCANKEELYSVLQLTVETVGGNSFQTSTKSNVSVVCKDCIKKPSASIPTILELNDTNKVSFNTELRGLVPGASYSYVFSSIDSNWPVTVYPISGIVSSASANVDIPTKLMFCRATGLCANDDTLSYALDNECLDKLVRTKLQITQLDCDDPVSFSSNELMVVCNDCIPELTANIPATQKLDSNTKNTFNFSANVSNLVVGSTYNYEFTSTDANWPLILYPANGTFVAKSSDITIPFTATFCRSTGVCPSSNENVLEYIIDNNCLDKIVRSKLTITQIGCEDTVSVDSNELYLVCDDCIPKAQAVLPSLVALDKTSKNILNFTANLSNLVAGTTYNYNFRGIEANWPAAIYPVSGSFVADRTEESIPASLTFCVSTGVCPPTDDKVLTNNLDASCYAAMVDSDKHTRLKLEIQPTDCDNATYSSNEMMVMCVDCLPKISINHGSLGETLSGPGNNNYQLTTTVSNLIPGQEYTYTITGLDGNWPMVVSKQSGEFLAVTSNKLVQTDLSFCFPSGSCAIDSRDVYLNYRSNSLYKNSDKKFFKLNMSIEPKNCDAPPTISEDFSVVCNNCLPETNLSVAISGSPILTLPLNCCSGTRLISANVTGAVPGESHSYNWISASNNIVLSPSSGTVLLNKNGAGSIMALMSTSLTNREQAILECRVTNSVSNAQATNFVVVRCGPECN
jgi:hypothetical protein